MNKFLTKVKPTRKQWVYIAVEVVFFALLMVADLVSKKYISAYLDRVGGSAEFMPGFISLYYTENTGASFGIFQNGTMPLIVLTAVVMAGLFVFLALSRKEAESIRIPLVAILAGGVGNLVDRISLGYVRDFFNFEFMTFGIFNVADACISVGAVVLVIVVVVDIIREAKREKKQPPKGDTLDE